MDHIDMPELLAPVGSLESLTAAINAGCDAVYFGVTQLNMRAASVNNFTVQDMKAVAETCHKRGVKCYLTLNTILYDHDLKLTKVIIDAVKAYGVDAIIASDMAAVMYAREVGVEVHLSTQMSISNIGTIKFYAAVADRIVLARELNLLMIKKICDEIKVQNVTGPSGRLVEIEVFIHGAMCVALSGRCSMSLYTHNSSANRGACKQNCRRTYTVTDEDGNQLKIDNNFVMSPEDLCTIGLLDQIVDSGVAVLKIEGRGRSPEYVDTVVRCYREALSAIKDGTYTKEKIDGWMQSLESVYNRGLGTGFYLGKQMKEWSGAYGSKATQEKEYVGDVLNYFAKAGVIEVEVRSGTVTEGQEYVIIGPKTGVFRGQVKDIFVNDEKRTSADRGSRFTLKVADRIRAKDKFYLINKA